MQITSAVIRIQFLFVFFSKQTNWPKELKYIDHVLPVIDYSVLKCSLFLHSKLLSAAWSTFSKNK